MPYGVIVGAQPVEIFPEQPFTTPQLKVAADEAKLYGVKVGTVINVTVQHAAGSLLLLTADDLDRYQIQQFAEAEPPAGQIVATRTLVVNGGVISVQATFEVPPVVVPSVINRMQAMLELHATPSPTNAGKTLLDDVNAAVTASTDPTLGIYWNTAADFHRDHPKLLALATALGLTSTQVDALFIAAAQLS